MSAARARPGRSPRRDVAQARRISSSLTAMTPVAAPLSLALRILPEDRTVHVPPGTNALHAIQAAGLELEAVCGGRGRCTSCRVRVVTDPVPPPQPAEVARLGPADVAEGFRLACQLSLDGDATLLLAPRHAEASHQILADGATVYVEVEPELSKVLLSAAPVRGEETPTSDLETLLAALPDPPEELELEALRALPQALREARGTLTAVLEGRRLVSVEAGDTRAALYGLALDVGTTTIVAYLVDLRTGQELATSSMANPQSGFGGDVISRIRFAHDHANGVRRLQRKVLDAVNELIAGVTQQAAVQPRHIYRIVVAGNTCMLHLFFGIDVRFLGLAPYAPVVRAPHGELAATLHLHVHPAARVAALPIIAGFVGGDTVGALLAADLAEPTLRRVLIDIGTNGEVVVASPKGLLACSAPAGPAFEGGQILHGMRAAHGAIDQLGMDGEVAYHVIGEGMAQGLCGSGIIDAVAGMLDSGVLEASGRFAAEDAPHLPAPLRRRFTRQGEVRAFVLARAEETAQGRDLVLTQKDVRELQLAKGAIRAAVEIALLEADLRAEDLDELLLAGGFGNYLAKDRAMRIGLIPRLPLERVRYIGNAAGAGAKLALLSAPLRRRSRDLSRSVRHVVLATHPEFENVYLAATAFPPAAPR